MKISVKGFFKKGNLLFSINETVEKIKKVIVKHANKITLLSNNQKRIADRINILIQENQDLKVRLAAIEDKLWESLLIKPQQKQVPVQTQPIKIKDKNNLR